MGNCTNKYNQGHGMNVRCGDPVWGAGSEIWTCQSCLEKVTVKLVSPIKDKPEYIVVCSVTIDRLLSAMEGYIEENGIACGLGPVVSDLKLMAMSTRLSIDESSSAQ